MLGPAQRVNAQDTPSQPAASDTTSGEAAQGDLFPGGGVQTPPATQGAPTGGGHRNGIAGGHQRNTRHHEQLVSLADIDPLAVRVAYRRAKTIAMARDPGLADLLREADAANDDVTRRAYLKEYYLKLYTSICKADPSPEVRAHVKLLRGVAEQRYDPKRREVGGDEDLVNGSGNGRRGRIQQ